MGVCGAFPLRIGVRMALPAVLYIRQFLCGNQPVVGDGGRRWRKRDWRRHGACIMDEIALADEMPGAQQDKDRNDDDRFLQVREREFLRTRTCPPVQ